MSIPMEMAASMKTVKWYVDKKNMDIQATVTRKSLLAHRQSIHTAAAAIP